MPCRLATAASANGSMNGRWGLARPGFARGLGERRGQLRLQFLAQLPLEIRIAEKTELGDKPQDSRRADPSAFGEFGHGRQSRRGIVRQQDLCGLALLRRQAADRRADVLRDGSAIVDRAVSITPIHPSGAIAKRDPRRRDCNESYEVDNCCFFGTTMTRRSAVTDARETDGRRRLGEPDGRGAARPRSGACGCDRAGRGAVAHRARLRPRLQSFARALRLAGADGRTTSSNTSRGTRARSRSAAASPHCWMRRWSMAAFPVLRSTSTAIPRTSI